MLLPLLNGLIILLLCPYFNYFLCFTFLFTFFYRRKNHRKPAPACPAVFHFDLSLMNRQNPLCQRQAKPVSFFLMSGVGLIKFIENPFQIRLRDPAPVIPHP